MVASIVLGAVIWLLKALTYRGVFKWREINATALDCLVIAGSSFLVSFVPLPGIFHILGSIALALFLTMHYTGVSMIPDGLFIPLGIECSYLIITEVLRAVGVAVA